MLLIIIFGAKTSGTKKKEKKTFDPSKNVIHYGISNEQLRVQINKQNGELVIS